MRVTSRPASTRLAAMQLPLAPVPKTAIFRDMAAPLEQRDMPDLNRQSRWILNQRIGGHGSPVPSIGGMSARSSAAARAASATQSGNSAMALSSPAARAL